MGVVGVVVQAEDRWTGAKGGWVPAEEAQVRARCRTKPACARGMM